jgi:Carboxypeptidase regulatory-like domain/TonB dependent receptor/TonB-dependent Receptor Plug Domain
VTKHRFLILCFVLLSVPLTSGLALGQGSSNSSISGVVVDSGGGTIPGASVIVKGESGEQFEAVTNTDGVFNVPSVGAGTYRVTVALAGFKTVEVEVRVLPNTPASIKATLEVGRIEETVLVTSSSELVNTQTATVAATLNADQLNRMPTPTRNALNAVTFLPGINTADTNRESRINGLPESFVQITLDGVSNNDNFLRSSDSFFASITPRQDAVEAVSVVTAAGGANVGGSGAVSVNFQTRSGTNRFSGTAYEYFRHPDLNSNNWLNERNGQPKNDVKLNQYGARIGGPVIVPGLFDGRGKMFYMVHYEQLRFPNSFTRSRTMLNPGALNGTFRYNVGTQTREVNVLDLARASGQISAIDPTVMSLLQRIQQSTTTTGTISQQSDPLLMTYAWQSPGKLFEHQPTVRVDYNLGENHRLSGTYASIWAQRDPDYLNGADARYPGAPVYRLFNSSRPLYRVGLRSTMTSNLVSELSGGLTALGGQSAFGDPISNGPQNFEDQTGYAIDFDGNIGLTNWHAENNRSWRTSPTFSIDESLTWQRGTHSVNFGGGFLHVRVSDNAQVQVPGIDLRFNTTNDPAAGLFTTANFQGASAAQLTDARELYALLTGRVGAVTGQAALDPGSNNYVAFGPRKREGYINMYSLFAQDSWRTTPTLTINAGVRWDLQMPFTALNGTMSAATMASVCGISGLGDDGTFSRCNFGRPGTAANAAAPEYVQLTAGTQGYQTDFNNIAPNVGIAWRPNVQDGFMRALLGDPEQATLRGGYSVAYDRQGMDQFTGLFGDNPGITLNLARNESTGLVGPGETWPVLLSQRSRLYNASFPESPTYPIFPRANRADNLSAFAPDITIGMAQTWTVSFQRSITRDMAVDIRYVGTRGSNQWSTLSYNDRQIEGNGFIEEFRLASANLQVNNNSGIASRRGSFAYFGPGSGTTPLPIYLAYLNGSRDAANPSAYAGGSQTWTNTAITQDLVHVWPDPYSSVADLDGNLSRRQNALAAGLPANFFVVNPDINTLEVTDSGAFSDYHALQIDLRRRLSKGLSAGVNYQYAIERGSAFRGFRYGREMDDQGNVRHAFKTQWDWTVPVGRGQRYGTNLHPIVDGIIGGWSVNGVGRVQARTVNIGTNVGDDSNFGNIVLVGMTKDELQKMYKHDIRINPANGLPTVYMLPDDVILNTRRAFSVDPTSPTGYSELGVPEGRFIAPPGYGGCIQMKAGDCGPATLLLRMPWFVRFDLGVTKKFPIAGSTNFEIRADVLNLFNNINFDPVTTPGSGAGIFQTTGFYDDPSNTYDPGGRIGSIMFRVNW